MLRSHGIANFWLGADGGAYDEGAGPVKQRGTVPCSGYGSTAGERGRIEDRLTVFNLCCPAFALFVALPLSLHCVPLGAIC